MVKNNSSSVSYNPITLKYNDTTEGAELKYQDGACLSVWLRGAAGWRVCVCVCARVSVRVSAHPSIHPFIHPQSPPHTSPTS